MQTKLLMSISALYMAALGLLASFLPQEILGYYHASAQGLAVVLIQAIGALYLGFAILNWMARASLIGGIYGKPVALGNFLHFAVLAVVLLKLLAAGSAVPEITAAAAIYAVFAVWFGLVVFTAPSQVAGSRQG
ncbi:MAG TPA: hypothetical protein VIF60_19525 [Burkholderiaceae bacterium]|jgi:hypothetical protein